MAQVSLIQKELATTCTGLGCPHFLQISEITEKYPNPLPGVEGSDQYRYSGKCQAMELYYKRLKDQKDFTEAQDVLNQTCRDIPEECPLNLVEY